MNDRDLPARQRHPEEMRASVHLRAGALAIRARASATPAGLVSIGILVSTILLSTAVLVRAARQPVRR
ncbi:hypothetical protein [Muricoccus vinaceus]|uniref:Uncharacterized protein n=1 Tax=Muricoccus vinaceus TaxID=424704 RepID=A0ABV6J0L5_9PROT